MFKLKIHKVYFKTFQCTVKGISVYSGRVFSFTLLKVVLEVWDTYFPKKCSPYSVLHICASDCLDFVPKPSKVFLCSESFSISSFLDCLNLVSEDNNLTHLFFTYSAFYLYKVMTKQTFLNFYSMNFY